MVSQLYLFYGEEEFLIREKLSELQTEIADPGLNLERLDASSLDLEQLISAIKTQPLLLGQKLLIIRDVDLRDPIWEKLAPHLQTMPQGIRLVLLARSLDKRTKIFKLLERLAEVCEFRPFTDWEQDQLVDWIARRVRSSGKEISRQAAAELKEICGNALNKLASEIDKLITYIGERQQITEQDVADLASPGQLNVFVLSDAVAGKDLKTSLAAYRKLQRNRLELFPVLAMLAGRYRIMLLGKSLRDPLKIAQTLKASPYYVKKCLREGGRFTATELAKNLKLLLETDLKLKSGEQPASVFELLLAELCGQ